MKKRTSKLLSLLLTLTMVLGMLPAMSQVAYAAGDVAIDATNFPDANFREFVKKYDKDSNSYLNPEEIAAVTEMECRFENIAALTGIEHFTAMTELSCVGNNLTELDVSKNTALEWLYCQSNQLTELDVSKNTNLTGLYCFDNNLTELDVSKNTALTALDCGGNQLTTLDVSKNTALTTLDCVGNQLTTLDVSANTALTELWCYGNNLTTLDVTEVPALKDAKENGTFDDSNSEYDRYSSSQGTLRVDKTVNILTDTSALGIAINATNFPDANFREFVKKYDENSNGYLSEAELTAVTEMECRFENIAALTGIEHFTAMTVLICRDNPLKSLDVSKNTALEWLYCQYDQLTELDVSKNTNLTGLYCGENMLTTLDVSKNTALTKLNCDGNQLTTLDVSANTALTELGCGENNLTELDVSANTALTELYCFGNNLTELDVSKNTALTELWCGGNQLTTLDVSANTALTRLWCWDNDLTELDVSAHTALTALWCAGNQLMTLDVSKNTALTELDCGGNQLTTLDVSAVPALKDAVENGTKDTSNSDYDNYSSSQGTLRVDKTVNILTDTVYYNLWVNGVRVNSANKDDILGDGKVSYTPGEGSGTLTITGTPTITGLHNNAIIYADGIDLTINAASGLTLNSSGHGVYVREGGITIGGNATITSDGYALYSGNGSVTINGDADLTTGINGYPVYSWNGVTITGNLKAETSSNDIVYTYDGDINIGGSVDAKTTNANGDGLRTPNGYISIGGNATVMAGGYALYSGNGSVTVNGNANLTTEDGGYPVYSREDVTITGDFTAETSSYDIIYVYNGNISIGGSVDAKTTNADGDGLRTPNGKITMTSGVWDITAGNYAFYAKNGIEIPSTHEVTLPDGGEINQVTVDDNTFYTVTEAGGSTVATHAVIEPGAAEPAQKYTITYTDGVVGKEIFADVVFTDVEEGSATPTISNPTRSGYTFTGWTPAVAATVTGDQTYTATWDKNSTGGGIVIPTVFPVTVKESDNGEVEASAKYAVPGSTVKLTVTPDESYELDTLTVKSGSKFIDVTEKNGKYQFVMPFGSVTVTATFKKIETPVVPDPVVPSFDDVAEDTYYFDAVEWAVENGITTGTSDTTFSPDMTCTRAQAVTFLWRAAGSPEPKSNVMPFEDVAAEAYYYKAVLWAVENGITKGTSETTFSPDADCTRAQIVTFLWRAQKSPAADSVNPFTDVAADAYYVDAVLWAVEEKVTKGTSETTFSPDADCTRAQIVTFLYRALNEQ